MTVRCSAMSICEALSESPQNRPSFVRKLAKRSKDNQNNIKPYNLPINVHQGMEQPE